MLQLSKIARNKVSNDLIVAILFGVISAVLGLIQIDTPGFEGSYSDLREVALLISLFYIINPLFLIPLCLITLLGLPFEIRLIPVFLMHLIPLYFTWHLYKSIEKKGLSTIKFGLIWFLITIAYYLLLLYPVLIVTYYWFGLKDNLNFIESYRVLFISGTLEMIATALVTSLYLVQFYIRKSLIETNKNLEQIVKHRTAELTNANFELKSLNENLEEIVKERTKKIDTQLNQIIKYVHMNSHDVRGPLARILGLMQLIENEQNEEQRKELLIKINKNSVELDVMVKKMNRILEQEL